MGLEHRLVLKETTGWELKGSTPDLPFAEKMMKGKCQLSSWINEERPSPVKNIMLKEPGPFHNPKASRGEASME